MDLILFTVVNVIIARWFEKRFIIAAAAHCVLFLVFGLCLLYCSDSDVISVAMRAVSGETVYEYIRYALSSPIHIFYFGYNAYLVIDISIIFMIIAVSAAVSGTLIHRAAYGRKKLDLKVDGNKRIPLFILSNNNVYKERIYIKYCRILD